MSRWLASVVAASIFVAVVSGSAYADRSTDARNALHAAQRTLDAGDEAGAIQRAQVLLNGNSYTSLSATDQHAVLLLIARARSRVPGCDVSLPEARRAAEAANEDPRMWSTYLAQTSACGEYENAAPILRVLTDRFPQAAAGLNDSEVATIVPYADEASLRFLLGPGWSHPATLDLSFLRIALMRRLLAGNNVHDASAIAHDMAANGRSDAGALVEFLSDRTFDRVVATDPAAFTFDAMSARQLANSEQDAATAPGKLQLVNTLAQNLLNRGRLPEASAVIEDALARQREGGSAHPTFSDEADNLNWTFDLYAHILRLEGRSDEALRAMQQGGQHGEGEGRTANVSQILNGIGLLIDSGRPQRALADLNRFDLRLASPYGRAVARQLRVCALADIGDEAAMRTSLADAVAHKSDSLVVLRSTAICAHDWDLAAATFLEQLADPAGRHDALISVQRYPNYDPQQIYALRELLGRPYVQAALEREARQGAFAVLRPF
jgi:tetratricopeptide (TPR) repeat protein